MFTARMIATERHRTVIEPGDLVIGVVFQDRDGMLDADQKATLLAMLGTSTPAAAPDPIAAHIPFSGPTVEALAASGRAADRLGHHWVRPEHMVGDLPPPAL